MSSFKTWWDEAQKNTKSSKMLTRVPKNKFDTTMEKMPGVPKKTDVTVWGAPSDFNYIRA